MGEHTESSRTPSPFILNVDVNLHFFPIRYIDTVFNHKFGADRSERFMATEVSGELKYFVISPLKVSNAAAG